MSESELISLRLFKEEATERMADDERHIASLNERIQVLEFHLDKLRDQLDRDGMKRGIQAAKGEGARVDGAALEAQLMRGIE